MARIRETASSMRSIGTRPALTSAISVLANIAKALGSMNMSMPALTPVRTCWAQSPGSWWMPSQSLITKPPKPSRPLSTPVISSSCACIFSGLPTPSSVQSTLEKDGMTVPTWCSRTAGAYGASALRQKSSRLVTATPWSIV